MKKNELIKIVAVALTTLLCISVTPAFPYAVNAEETRLYGGTLKVGLYTEVLNFALFSHTHGESSLVGEKMIQTLVTFDFDLNVKPLLAESWEISPDCKTYTFNLVRNAMWHDGEPFTSADVKYSVEQMEKKYRGAVGLLKNLDVVETPDNYTAVFKFNKSVPPFIYYCGDFFGIHIFPKHLYEGTDLLNNPCNLAPVGTGPFIFVEWKRGEYIKLKRNPNYWKKGEPYLDAITFIYIPDRSVMAMSFEKRDIDYCPLGFSLPDMPRLEQMPGVKVELTKGKELGGRVVLCLWNLNNEYMKDINVRKALFHSFDREKVCKLAYCGYAVPAYSFFVSSIPWCYNKAAEFKDLYPFDLDEANKILDAAGYKRGSDGVRFVLTGEVWPEYAEEAKAYELWREDLLKIGIDFKYAIIERTVGVIHLKDLTYGAMAVTGLSCGPNPAVSMARWLLSARVGLPYTANHMNYTNPRIDELFEIAQTNPNVEEQKKALYEIQEILNRDIPYIPLVEFPRPLIYWEDEWGGIPFGPTDNFAGSYATCWWKKGAELSPEGILKMISDAEAELKSLASQFYNVEEAQKKLNAAKEAYNASDYASALALVKEVRGLAVRPYWLYATIAIIVIIPGVTLYIRRKRKRVKG